VNKAGFVVSLIGGLLAILFSLLLVVTGPYFYAGSDIADFAEENEDDLPVMWMDIGKYNDVEMLPSAELDNYIEEYSEVLQDTDAEDLQDIGDEYDVKAFDDLARIYEDIDEYIPRLKICILVCLAASVIALAGAAVAKVAKVAGGVMVLSGAGLLLIFSLLASSILPMALASLLLLAGGLLQIARRAPRKSGEVAK
jgi:hypothetical protein